MKLDNEMNFILKEQPMWFCKLSIQEKIDIAMLLQRYAEQLNILPVSKSEGDERKITLVAFAEWCKIENYDFSIRENFEDVMDDFLKATNGC